MENKMFLIIVLFGVVTLSSTNEINFSPPDFKSVANSYLDKVLELKNEFEKSFKNGININSPDFKSSINSYFDKALESKNELEKSFKNGINVNSPDFKNLANSYLDKAVGLKNELENSFKNGFKFDSEIPSISSYLGQAGSKGDKGSSEHGSKFGAALYSAGSSGHDQITEPGAKFKALGGKLIKMQSILKKLKEQHSVKENSKVSEVNHSKGKGDSGELKAYH